MFTLLAMALTITGSKRRNCSAFHCRLDNTSQASAKERDSISVVVPFWVGSGPS